MLRRVDWLMVADLLETPSKRRQLFSNQNDDNSQKTSFNLQQAPLSKLTHISAIGLSPQRAIILRVDVSDVIRCRTTQQHLAPKLLITCSSLLYISESPLTRSLRKSQKQVHVTALSTAHEQVLN